MVTLSSLDERVEHALRERDMSWPEPPRPAGNYVPVVIEAGLVFVSAQFPLRADGPAYVGAIGAELDIEDGRRAAELAALNVLAQLRTALGSFDRLGRLLRVEGHLACDPGFDDAPLILDAASDFFVAALGDKGVHTRSAFTHRGLPRGLPVELVVTASLQTPTGGAPA